MSEKSAKTDGVAQNLARVAPPVAPDSPVIDPVTTNDGLKPLAGAAGSKRKSAREKIAGAAKSTGSFVKDAAVLVGDLNGDGKVGQEDARIAGRKARKVASATAAAAGKLGKGVLQHDMGKDAAAGAAIGAVVALPIPIVGPVAGAAVGAIAGVIKNVRSRKK